MALTENLAKQYRAFLDAKEIAPESQPYFIKWLRYFLHFCEKYPVPREDSERLRLYLEKLREKNQDGMRRRQAARAVTLYFGMQGSVATAGDEAASSPLPASPAAASYPPWRNPQCCEAGYEVKSDSPEWDELLSMLAAEIKVRHYSRKTLKSYALWARQFQRFLKNKPPPELGTSWSPPPCNGAGGRTGALFLA